MMLLLLALLSLVGSYATTLNLIQDTTTQSHFYKPGVCQDLETKRNRCSLTSDDCIPRSAKNGERWMNSAVMEQAGLPSCSCEKTEIKACFKAINGGNSKEYRCAPRKDDYCDQGDDNYGFVPTNAVNSVCFCDDLRSMIDAPEKPTLYGACVDPADSKKFFCAFSPDYCELGHTWVDPLIVKILKGENYCTCENTRVGGCVGGFNGFHCAIAEDDCLSNNYINPLALKTKHNHACFLCNKRTRLYKKDEIDNTSSQSNSNTTVIVALCTTIGAIGLVAIVVYSQRVRQKKDEKDDLHQPKMEMNFSENKNPSRLDATEIS
uniref:EGF-like domain-containing protein n=1 Tax=Eucampia antarctica TaxID=49252 RepID=A0A7S2WIY2_9STRA|mmetsp:Transcript_3616/g.3416  ORF Transcript_3616/g.3416 Transcript_3616/m.3416 type:complete len:321 (+) Transcript_3616:60-1022(+)|eukprot:CAMPEP_0197829904 /NCGR_PEP_ID=MMETSP1437-20131217/6458_1 /TAXON_ID=49252 ORGANISM="Eucampia antarctica, Strain CCMP1452" /NCGR_SAMPLE_ID=MMETSP1437 /ASSEMBLY_ACC=CAM_ASM_001096 /LENGTH=320 /DNA_ID=CAMNT_0043431919 /DNA_START=123 /DNA_END=1085 /DNA_ORIENTATION=+